MIFIQSSDIGGTIRTMREERSLSQISLAERAQIAQSTLSYIESGKKSPTFETLNAIANGLQVSIMDILSYTISETAKKSNHSRFKDSLNIHLPEDIGDLTEEDLSNLVAISNLLYTDFKNRNTK